jgi:hypothetical protein
MKTLPSQQTIANRVDRVASALTVQQKLKNGLSAASGFYKSRNVTRRRNGTN